jgi:inward rectifier potassium channel
MPDRPLEQDPGFGQRVLARGSRLIGADGSFQVRRLGVPWWDRIAPYRWLSQISWLHFVLVALCGYALVNTWFACGFLWIGVDHLAGLQPATGWENFWNAWFFSAQTLTTVGYGHVSPSGWAADALASAEALVGLLGFGLWTGILFARFSRARSNLSFSEVSVIAPHRDGQAWMFRLASRQDQVILEAEASILFSWVEQRPDGPVRHYRDMPLERPSIRALPLNWTLVHVVDEQSPLYGKTPSRLEEADAEILAFVRFHDDAHGQTVHARASWKASEILFGHKFRQILSADPEGRSTLDLGLLSTTDPV